MTFLKRDLCREIADTDRCFLVLDTDSKRFYVELKLPHQDATVDGTIRCQMATINIADYLKHGTQTAGHHELWQLLVTLFAENDVCNEYTDDASSAAMTYSKLLIWENCSGNSPMF